MAYLRAPGKLQPLLNRRWHCKATLLCSFLAAFAVFLKARNPEHIDFPCGKYILFIKCHVSRSMLKGIEREPKATGLGRRKGPKNQ